MLIQKIKIRGSIGIRKGLGLEEIEIDFTNRTGLIALSGPNGRGKTTILELMSPYRTFASRKGALNHHFELRDSYIEKWFEFNGDQYHTTIKIDAGSDRSEAFIEVNGESEVNGKVKAYDQYILSLFGSQVLFYNSVFCAQGSENFSDMTTGEIKKIFIEFLQLYKLTDYEAKSKQAINLYETKLQIADNEASTIKSTLDNLDTKIQGFDSLTESNLRVKKMIKEDKAIIEEETSVLEDLNKTKILNDQIAKEMERIDEQVKTLGIEQAQIKRDRLHAEEKHANDILLIAEERQELSEIINQKEMIEKASDRVAINVEKEEYFSNCFECVLEEQARLDKESKKIGFDISTLEATHAKLENNSDIAELTASIDTGNVKLRTAKDKQASLLLNRRQVENDHEITDIETKIARCKKDIELAIDPACESKICPALLLVADAKKELPALEDALKSKAAINQSKILEIDTSLKIIDAKIIVTKANIETLEAEKKETDTLLDKQLKKISDEIDEKRKSARAITSKFLQSDDAKIFYRDSRNECRRNINEAKSFAEKLSELKVAESKKESLGSQEKEKIAGWLELKQEFDEKFGAKVLTIAELNDKSLFIDEKINVTVNVDIMVCKKTITDKQKEIEELKGIESDNNMKIAVIEDCKKQKEELYLSLKDNQAFKTAVGKEILDWTYLRDACSKTGLQALEIDGAAPLITREANTLLETTFGLDFQIKIVTQDPETGKEVFWVMVIRDDGSEDKFDKLSGGQKVWIAKALTLGMTLVSKDKSGKAFLTLFADEEDGALDPKRSIDFISLYRTMLQAGEFESCMYISHKPEIVAMADNILDFSGDTLSWE